MKCNCPPDQTYQSYRFHVDEAGNTWRTCAFCKHSEIDLYAGETCMDKLKKLEAKPKRSKRLKKCRLCNEREATVPERRSNMGRRILTICSDCHAARLADDFKQILHQTKNNA